MRVVTFKQSPPPLKILAREELLKNYNLHDIKEMCTELPDGLAEFIQNGVLF